MTPHSYNLALLDIVRDAALPMQGLMLILVIFSLSAIVVAATKLRGDISGGSAWLAALRWAGPLSGLFGAAYTTLFSFLALSKRGDVTLAVMAPGLAEAALALGLGLLSGTLAAIATGMINARIDRAVLGTE